MIASTSPARPRRAFALVLLAAACGGEAASGPLLNPRVPLTPLSVPAEARATDTVVVSFRYDDSCGPRRTNVSFGVARVEIEVRAEFAPDQVCAAMLRESTGYLTLLPAQRAPTTTVVFLQPSGMDSVRTIREVALVGHAP